MNRSPGSIRQTVMQFVRTLAFVVLTASITVVGSERVFWYWSPGFGDHLFLAAFYAIPAAVTLWAIQRYRVNAAWPLLLATPIYGYLTEGFITPVLYSGGPFVPFFPAYFAFWHGAFAFFGLWYLVRRWAVREDRRRLLAFSAFVGVNWGLWSATFWLPDNLEDPDLLADHGELVAMTPWEFTGYVAVFTLILAVSHWLAGLVWPQRLTAPRPVVLGIGALTVAGVAMWSVVYLWAIPMFAVYVWIQRWGLSRHAASAADGTLFDALRGRRDGRLTVSSLAPLIAMIPTAAAVYAALWALDPAEDALRVLMYSMIGLHAVAGAVVTIQALRRAVRTSAAQANAERNATTLEPSAADA